MIKQGFKVALIQCEECGSEVSTKAIKCPNCGFNRQDNIDRAMFNILVWFTIFPIFGYFVICLSGIYFGFFDYSNAFFSHEFSFFKSWLYWPLGFLFVGIGENRHSVLGGYLNAFAVCFLLWIAVDWIIPDNTGKEESFKASVNNSGWSTSSTTDVMTEVKSYHAISNQTGPIENLKFPYGDVKSYISFSCQPSNGFQIYFVFNKTNIPGMRYKNGDKYIDAKVKFDNNIQTYPLLFVEGINDSLYFTNDSDPVLNLFYSLDRTLAVRLLESKSMLLELEYHNNGYVHFRYDLNGSDAIKKTLLDCGLPPSQLKNLSNS